MNVVSSTPISDPVGDSPEALVAPAHRIRQTVLAYHELSAAVTDYRYAVSSRLFEQHVRLVARVHEPSRGYMSPLVISFDDGHISNYTLALPVLEKYACKAIFFVIAGRIGENENFMTWNHLRELVALGHCVESHSWSHRFLTGCSDTELREEVKRSRETIEDRLGVSVDAFSAPHGRWDLRTLRACADAGYHRLYTSNPWCPSRTMESVKVRGRLMVVQSMSPARLSNWLTMGPAEVAFRRTQHNLKCSAQRVLGDKLYYQLWAYLSGWKGRDDTSLTLRP